MSELGEGREESGRREHVCGWCGVVVAMVAMVVMGWWCYGCGSRGERRGGGGEGGGVKCAFEHVNTRDRVECLQRDSPLRPSTQHPICVALSLEVLQGTVLLFYANMKNWVMEDEPGSSAWFPLFFLVPEPRRQEQ